MSKTLREELKKILRSHAGRVLGTDYEQGTSETIDELLALIASKMPEKAVPERGLQTSPCGREKCGMCNRVKGWNAYHDSVKSILKGGTE